MNQEVISDKQRIFVMILFLVGSTSIFAPGLEAKKDAWIAVILAMLAIIPMLFIYGRIHSIFPNKDLLDIIEICFGRFAGKLVIVFFISYTIYWASDVLNNYSFFITTTSLNQTPRIILIIFMSILCIWSTKEGIEVLGKFSELFLIPLVSFFLIIIFLSIPNININNIKPILNVDNKSLLEGSFSVFSQPFAQVIAFSIVFSSFKNKKSPYKVYFLGLLVSGIYMTILTLVNILILGENLAISNYYPAYASAKRVDIGTLLQRIEVLIDTSFVIGGFIKVSILLICGCKAINKLFKCNDYRFIIIPFSLMVINLAYFQYNSVMNYMEFNSKIWPYYFFPFQIIGPIIIWIIAEIKNRQSKM